MREIVAWDVFEWRIYGAPGERRHRVLWVEHYCTENQTTPDLDWLLYLARERGIDEGSKTIHVRPLVYGDDGEQNDSRILLERARNMLSHPESWRKTPEYNQKRIELLDEISKYLNEL